MQNYDVMVLFHLQCNVILIDFALDLIIIIHIYLYAPVTVVVIREL
jgi:hypothetical protein